MRYILTMVIILVLSVSGFADTGAAVRYEVGGQNYEGFYISAGKKAPFVFLLHDWDGVTEYEVRRARMLADIGYSVFVADLFGTGVRPTKVKDKMAHTGELYKDRDKMRVLMVGALKEARSRGADLTNAVASGYCFGGAAVLELARSGADFRGFAVFHGGLKTPEGQDYSKAKAEVLVLHGSADSAVTMDDFAALATELNAIGIRHEMVTYGGAPHAFTVFGGQRYHAEADKKSWDRFLRFLEEKTK